MILDIALLFSNLLGYVDALLMNGMLSLLQLLNDMVVAWGGTIMMYRWMLDVYLQAQREFNMAWQVDRWSMEESLG